MAETKNYLDFAGLTAYDTKLKAWIKSGTTDITDDEIRALFATSAYEMVDLGLSVKWANMNVGASSPEENGLYFDWGNTEGHAVDESGNVVDGYSFDKNTYSNTLGGKYTGSTLDAEHDAATVNMGSDWRMPTTTEIDELVDNTDHYFIGEDGNIVAESELSFSKKLRSICLVKKDESFDYDNRTNFIEFPFAGYCKGSLVEEEGLQVNLWTSSTSDAVYASFLRIYSNGGHAADGIFIRVNGLSVRGVHE